METVANNVFFINFKFYKSKVLTISEKTRAEKDEDPRKTHIRNHGCETKIYSKHEMEIW